MLLPEGRLPECRIPPGHILECRALLETYHGLRAEHTVRVQRIQTVLFHTAPWPWARLFFRPGRRGRAAAGRKVLGLGVEAEPGRVQGT
jgi:hypothetical protein